MGKKKKRGILIFASMALVLVGSVGVHEALAYFTTYVQANGGYEVTLGAEAALSETVENMTKYISVSNTGDMDCYVRVKIFSGDMVGITYASAKASDGSDLWIYNSSDGYWYYKDVVAAGGKTGQITAKIVVPEDIKDSFNVVVVQECTQVLYREDGTAYADWSLAYDTSANSMRGTGQGGSVQ